MRDPIRGSLALAALLLTAASLAGCIGSKKPYDPYRGEKRPFENPPPDPDAQKLELQTMTYQQVQDDLYFTQTQKDVHAVTTSVPRNPWRSYEGDLTNDRMKFLLGPYANIKKADVLVPEDPTKKKATTEGEEGQPTTPTKKEEKKEGAEKKEGESGGDMKKEGEGGN